METEIWKKEKEEGSGGSMMEKFKKEKQQEKEGGKSEENDGGGVEKKKRAPPGTHSKSIKDRNAIALDWTGTTPPVAGRTRSRNEKKAEALVP